VAEVRSFAFDGLVVGIGFWRNAAREKLPFASAAMTFSTWAAITLRWVNSGFWKRLRMRRSVSRCWISISSTLSSESSGLSEARTMATNSAKAAWKSLFFLWASSM
jgi:hypothetical protein